MKTFNKKIYIPLIVALVLLVLIVISANKSSHNNSIQPSYKEKQILSNRDLAIKKILQNPSNILQKATINGNSFILIGYDDTFYGGGPKENKPGWKFGGIIVFKIDNGNPIMFWESKEAINTGSSRFLDINNDGIPEIVWEGYFGATGRDSAFYVYKFNDTGFKLITPVEIIKTSLITYSQTTLGGDSELTYMKDIDGDKIQEIIVGTGEKNGNKEFEVYKYDGEKYYFWKRGRVGAGDIQPQFWGSFDPSYIKRFIEK